MVAHGTPCLGPGHPRRAAARCAPRYHRGCYGCFGPTETPNTDALVGALAAMDVDDDDIGRLFHTFNAWSEPFRERAGRSRRRREAHHMTHRATGGRALSTDALARVEGEGAMHVEIATASSSTCSCDIYEPPRFFEGFLRGRRYTEPPDITARICGICPVAYQMSACAAIEDAVGVDVDGPLRRPASAPVLRRVDREPHPAHPPAARARLPRLRRAPSSWPADHRGVVERGLELKKIGNEILETIGGRAIHPVNVRVGGFYRVPTRRALQPLRDRLRAWPELAVEVGRVGGRLRLPRPGDATTSSCRVDHPDEYPCSATGSSPTGGSTSASASSSTTSRSTRSPHSTALHARLLERGEYLVGPAGPLLALRSDQLGPRRPRPRRAAGLGPTCRNPFRSIIVRAVEVVHACETPSRSSTATSSPTAPRSPSSPGPASATASPRRPAACSTTATSSTTPGTIADAVIVPPTSQNQPTIEHDLFHFVERHLDLDDDELRRDAEVTIRNHDPCICCATHFLDLTVVRS